MKPSVAASSVLATIMLAACGGGGGGSVNSTPTPPASPTPTPAPTNATLMNLVASQQFTNDAVTSNVTLDSARLTTASSQGASTLTVRYDAASNSYTVATGGRSETFGPGDRVAPASPGQIDYVKNQGSVRQYLTLTEAGSPVNLGIQYVGGGYWQRNETLAAGALGLTFDAFTYGLETGAAAVPRTGSAGYNVDLFGFFAPLNRTPKAVIGEGTFVVDLRNGMFATSGTAHEVDLTDPYYTGTHDWRGQGYVSAATNGFNGVFAYDGRERFSVAGAVDGRFYGPGAQELGAVFHANDGAGTLLTGTLLGNRSAGVTVPALNVLDSDVARSFFNSQHSVLYLRNNGATSVEGAASVFPDTNGRVDIAADDSVRIVPKLSGELPSPTFTSANRVAAESNARYTTYALTQGDGDYRLTMYNPGAGNTELALTYTSFGRWDRVAQMPTREETANVWFAYGVPTATGTLARTGTASYAMTLHGSGVTFADAVQYAVSGTATMSVDFATMNYSGTLDALATALTGGSTIDFVPLAFGGEMFNTYGFQSYLSSRPGFADGQIRGRLNGPRGEEVGASFDILSRNAAGFATGMFAGVAVGKKN